jgi:hypothetical protein
MKNGICKSIGLFPVQDAVVQQCSIDPTDLMTERRQRRRKWFQGCEIKSNHDFQMIRESARERTMNQVLLIENKLIEKSGNVVMIRNLIALHSRSQKEQVLRCQNKRVKFEKERSNVTLAERNATKEKNEKVCNVAIKDGHL